jgi:sialate O-acetylesterase
MITNANLLWRTIFFSLLLSFVTFGQVRLPRLISDGIVLQRDAGLKIWGWSTKNEKISIRFMNLSYNISADDNGDWELILPKQNAGGPYEMEINASNSITIHNILIGDVWICSGQSNMELPMQRVSPIYESEIANCANDNIRIFTVPQKYNFNQSQKDFEAGSWQPVNPKSILSFSAVAYFFGKELYEKYIVPVGLINASLGGAPAEAWMSEDAIKEFPQYYDEAQKFKDASIITKIETSDRKRSQSWYSLLRQKDEGYEDLLNPWYKPDLNTCDWSSMEIPGYWADNGFGSVNGVVWFRKNFDVPLSMVDREAKLILGRIVDADSVFINGKFIGSTGYQYPPRRYNIPINVLKEGENSIVVRVISNSGKGGFVPDKQYKIICGKDTIDLRGKWHAKLGAAMEPLAGETFIRWKPVGLYNAMIAPLVSFKIKGAIWYQGESNVSRAVEYRKLFPALINNWHSEWQQGNFPFIYVQLPNFGDAKEEPAESDWAMLQEAQLKTLSVPNTAMVVAIDLGEWNDIHPLNKKDIGKRLALAAENKAYGEENLVACGPLYKSMRVEGNKIILSFTNTGSGLTAKDGKELKYFSIAEADKKFVWANAKIENDEVVVWSDDVAEPIAVRYAWADNPAGANLYNKEGLPASPFRTDGF